MKTKYETQAKYGRNWTPCAIRDAETPRGAALMTGYVEGRKVIRVRPVGGDKWTEFRFMYVPELHHGS